MTRVVLLLAFGVACSVSPDDGQFLCSDGVCPSGQVCVDGVCRDDEGLDAGERDGGMGDASTDADLPDSSDRPDGSDDAGRDASLGDEECSAVGDPQVDEDGDGAIDEGCPWFFGNAHPVLDVPVGPGMHWSPALGGSGSSLYFGYSGEPSGVYLARRDSPAERFALRGEPELLLESPTADPVYVVAIDGAETTLVAQIGGMLYRAERDAAGDAFGEWMLIGTGTHPTLRGDGLELVYNEGDRLGRRTRSSRGLPFGPVSSVLDDDAGQFPRMTPDGRTLFYQASDGSQRIASRASLEDRFRTDTDAELALPVAANSFSVSTSTREVFFVVVGNGPATQSIWRAEVCRRFGCPPRPVTCPVGFQAVGTNCYERSEDGYSTLGAARDHCATREATLASVASVDERELLERAGMLFDDSDPRSVWTGGMTESLATGMVDYTWPTDEAFVEYAGAWSERPGVGDLMSRCIGVKSSGWVARSCSGGVVALALCQIVRWPTWGAP